MSKHLESLYQNLLNGKLPHNLSWSEAVELVEHLGEVQPHGGDEFVFRVGSQRVFFKRPQAHDLGLEEVSRLRKFLKEAGPSSHAEGPAQPSRMIVVIDHHAAHVYQDFGGSRPADEHKVQVTEQLIQNQLYCRQHDCGGEFVQRKCLYGPAFRKWELKGTRHAVLGTRAIVFKGLVFRNLKLVAGAGIAQHYTEDSHVMQMVATTRAERVSLISGWPKLPSPFIYLLPQSRDGRYQLSTCYAA